jgi:integrase
VQKKRKKLLALCLNKAYCVSLENNLKRPGMSVSKRRTSKGITDFYHYRFSFHGNDYSGVCEGCRDKEAAKKYEKGILDSVSNASKKKNIKAVFDTLRDEMIGETKITLDDAFDVSLKNPGRKRKKSEKVIKAKKSRWMDFTAFIAANYPDVKYLADIRQNHAKEYIQYIRVNGRYNKKVVYGKGIKTKSYKTENTAISSKTCNDIHLAVSEVFRLLHHDAGLIENPFDAINKAEGDPEARDIFTENDLKLIRDNPDPFVSPLFTIGTMTAMREGDICTLKWSHVCLNDKIITKKMRKTGKIVDIPIMPPLYAFFSELKKKGNGHEYVLPDQAEMYLNNPSGVSWRVKKYLERLKIKTSKSVPGRTRRAPAKDFHSLRHTFCYLAGIQGIPIAIVQSICGHMTKEMTNRYQQHANRKDKREMLEKLPDFLIMSDKQKTLPMMEPARIKMTGLARTLPLITVETIVKKYGDKNDSIK